MQQKKLLKRNNTYIKIQRHLIAVLTSLVLCLFSGFGVSAQNVPGPVLSNIIRSYTPWKSAEFSGKVKADKLPLSPTVKIYMVRDSLVQISLRAPLIGEVGRIELTQTTVLAVNKYHRNYACESAQNLMEIYPSVLSDLQSLLLARVFVPGGGELSAENCEVFETGEAGGGNWWLVPADTESVGPYSLNYGFVVSPKGRTLAMTAEVGTQYGADVVYDYPGSGEEISITPIVNGVNKSEITLDFNSVKWGGKKMDPVRTDKYERVSLKDFIKRLI